MHTVSEDKSCRTRPTVIFTPNGQHTATMIFFHGLGGSCYKWKSGIGQFAKEMPHVKFIVPTAPTIPVTFKGGAQCSAWFDICMRGTTQQDLRNVFLTKPPMIESSAREVMQIIAAEVKSGIPVARILFGGISMGAFLATWIALHLQHTSAGVMMLSSMLFGPNHIKATSAGKKTPFLYFHGERDEVMPLFAANMSKERLEEMGVSVKFKTFPRLGHTVDPQELNEARKWVKQQLPAEVDRKMLSLLANSQEADFEEF